MSSETSVDELTKDFESALKIKKYIFHPYNIDFETLIPNVKLKKCIVSIILYHLDEKENIHILVQKRSKLMRNAGEICGPGGTVDPNETWLEALIREVYEESGINLNQISTVIWPVSDNVKEDAPVYSVSFAAKIPKNYNYTEPSHIIELDKTFFDNTQTNIKNYHRWINIKSLFKLNLLRFFRLNVNKFLKIRVKVEKSIEKIQLEKID